MNLCEMVGHRIRENAFFFVISFVFPIINIWLRKWEDYMKTKQETLSINFLYYNVVNCAGGRDDIIIVTIVG